MLDHAGVAYAADPSSVDEGRIKAELDDPEQIAEQLAAVKALDVSKRHDRDWIIGSDSVVSVEGRLFDKPVDRDQAMEHLRFFSARIMRLTSAVAIVQAGSVAWTHVESALLHVRTLSDRFIQDYLDAEWPDVGYCVGVFRLEGRGVQLFDRIDGDYFTILGMPLLPLLGALRDREIISS
ncbi:Maf family protein [Sphingomonas sp. SE220]|uniref:Nucleoside triphosphate pyrophosphatase n=2 Tax=Sphingomonas hankyongi TaxID=2908209 RepID=A0ABT0S4Z2_9SPHN|nr:Maf family protein [Sphingomonas hankyongi]